jgi:hemoglobin-like flavoprotein
VITSINKGETIPMALQIELLETSFQAIAPRGEEFVTAFYERLFTRFPETRAFFASTNMQEQRKKLLGALALVVQNLRKPDVLTAALQGLGQRHVGYGVKPEHYVVVGSILLETFADFLGERWTPVLRDAWTEAYGAVCSIMLEGAKVPTLA